MEKINPSQSSVRVNKCITACLCNRQFTESAVGWSLITPTSVLWPQYQVLSDFINRMGKKDLYAWAYGHDVKRTINSQLHN